MINELYRLLKNKKNTLIVLQDEKKEDIVSNFFSLSGGSVGVVSAKFPLLSNLEIVENIFLPLMYKRNLSLRQCCEKFYPWLKELDLEKIMWLRKEKLGSEEIFRAMFLRALCTESEVVFFQYPQVSEIELVIKFLKKLNISRFLWILVTAKEAPKFYKFNFEQVEL
ncbi:MAG: putative transport system ATP-binding protein [Desulfonauticus sp.]|jgi:ABC-type lipoprotein export system ATPase subunit|nr:putative transport system ATP-binding protein [Desulfonauticus sp.]